MEDWQYFGLIANGFIGLVALKNHLDTISLGMLICYAILNAVFMMALEIKRFQDNYEIKRKRKKKTKVGVE